MVDRPYLSPGPILTGVGSLPHVDPEEAVAFVARHAPEAPFWPQLPQRHPGEGMIAQVLAGCPFELTWRDGRPIARTPASDELVAWLEHGEAALDQDSASALFALTARMRDGAFPIARMVKAQLAGPCVTTATLHTIAPDVAVDRLRAAVTARLTRLARWLVGALPPDVPRLVIVDEPLQGAIDDDDHHSIVTVLHAIRAEGAAAGLHGCGSGSLDPLVACDPDVLSFDASYGAGRIFRSEFALDWLQRGGRLAAGLAPTDRELTPEEATEIARTYQDAAELADMPDPAPWAVTAACGLGLRSVELAERVFVSTRRIRDALT